MDWKLAIKMNREALVRIVAGLAALLGAYEDVLRLPRGVYQHLGLNLHKAEAALRRLIVMAARGLVVPLLTSRKMPEGFVIKRKAGQDAKWRAFPLFDSRANYSFEDVPNGGSPIHYIDDATLQAKFPSLLGLPTAMLGSRRETFSSTAETKSLRLRLAATARALQNLNVQAKRMARWQARRKTIENSKFMSPLRPGPPPGNNKKSNADIDLILRECHGLAFEALKLDSS